LRQSVVELDVRHFPGNRLPDPAPGRDPRAGAQWVGARSIARRESSTSVLTVYAVVDSVCPSSQHNEEAPPSSPRADSHGARQLSGGPCDCDDVRRWVRSPRHSRSRFFTGERRLTHTAREATNVPNSEANKATV